MLGILHTNVGVEGGGGGGGGVVLRRKIKTGDGGAETSSRRLSRAGRTPSDARAGKASTCVCVCSFFFSFNIPDSRSSVMRQQDDPSHRKNTFQFIRQSRFLPDAERSPA